VHALFQIAEFLARQENNSRDIGKQRSLLSQWICGRACDGGHGPFVMKPAAVKAAPPKLKGGALDTCGG